MTGIEQTAALAVAVAGRAVEQAQTSTSLTAEQIDAIEALGRQAEETLAAVMALAEVTVATSNETTGTAQASAGETIARVLADGGWHARSEVVDACAVAGAARSTIDRAARQMGVQRRRRRERHATTEWRLG